MNGPDPNLLVAGWAVGGLVIVGIWRLLKFVKESPKTPDPWDAEMEQQLSEAKEVCPHCLTEQTSTAWFCPRCNRAVGPYNNLMPYLQIFSEGEVLRNGTTDRMRASPIIPIGYCLLSLSFVPFIFSGSQTLAVAGVAALLSYWSLLIKNFKRSKAGDAESSEENPQ